MDVGSVALGRFAWAAVDAPSPTLAAQGSDPETAVLALAEDLASGGRAALVHPTEHERLARTGPHSWVPAPREAFVRIEAELVTGRASAGGRTVYGIRIAS